MSTQTVAAHSQKHLPATPRASKPRAPRYLGRWGLPLLLGGSILYFTLAPATAMSFPSSANLQALCVSNSVLAMAAVGLLFPMVTNQFDLSVGANLGLTSIATALLIRDGMPIVLAFICGLAVAMTVGLFNGLLVTVGRVHSFIATLGVSTVIAGSIQALTAGQSILVDLPDGFQHLVSERWVGIPRLVFPVLVVAIIAYYLLQWTPWGRALFAVGSSEEAARLVGLRTPLLTVSAFVASGACAGAAGLTQVLLSGGANPQIGPGYMLPAFAVVFLGATVSRFGFFNVAGVLLAVAFIATTVSGLVLSGVQSWVEQVFQGAVLIVAVGLSKILGRNT